MATHYKNTVGGTITFTNPLNGFNKGSGYGAAFGSKFGGWGALIGAAAGGIVGSLSSLFQNHEMKKAAQAQFQAANQANKATLGALAQNLADVNRQRSILFMETQSALAYLNAKESAGKGTVTNAIASADQVGSAMQIMNSQVQMQTDNKRFVTKFNTATQVQNQNRQLQAMYNNAKEAFVGVNIQGGQFSFSQALNDIMGSVGAMMQGGGGQMFSGNSSSNNSSSNAGNMSWFQNTNLGQSQNLVYGNSFGSQNDWFSGTTLGQSQGYFRNSYSLGLA